jgi:hypothetical protein
MVERRELDGHRQAVREGQRAREGNEVSEPALAKELLAQLEAHRRSA